MLIYIFILVAILGVLYYITKEPYSVVVPIKQGRKTKYIVRDREPVGWDLLTPYYPGYPSYPYYRYKPVKRGYFYV